MIVDKLINAGLYHPLGKGIEKGLDFLKENAGGEIASGKYPIDGENIFALCQVYDTRPIIEAKWEAHEKYIDIQYIVSGCEKIGYACRDDLEVNEKYDEKKDAMLLDGSGDMITMTEGSFMILYPDDAHMPCVTAVKDTKVKKIVVKVKI